MMLFSFKEDDTGKTRHILGNPGECIPLLSHEDETVAVTKHPRHGFGKKRKKKKIKSFPQSVEHSALMYLQNPESY